MLLLLIATVVAVGVVPMLAEARRGEFTFFNPKNLFVVYYVVLLGLSGLLMVAGGPSTQLAHNFATTPVVYETALWIAIAGLLAFQCGYYVQRRLYVPLPRLMQSRWPTGRVVLVAAACYAAGALAFLSIMHEAGGVGSFLAIREGWRAGGMKGHGIALLASTTLVANASHLLFIHFVGAETSRRRVAFVLLCYLASAVPAVVFGFRSTLGLPFMQLLLLWNFRRRRISAGGLTAVLLVMAAVFTGYGIVRELPSGISFDLSQLRAVAAQRPDVALAVVARTRGVEILADVVHRLNESGDFDTSPKSLVEAATIVVPSSVWPDKPLSTGERFTTYFFGEDFVYARHVTDATFGGVSPTITAEFYWHLGLTAVIVGLFLFGFGVRVVYRTMREYADANGVLLVYATLFTSIGLMAESFQNYLNGIVITSLVLGAMLVAVTLRLPSTAVAASPVGEPS